MSCAWLGSTSVFTATLLALACRNVPQAPRVPPSTPPPFETLTLDRITGFDADVSGTWRGLNILVAPDRTMHIVSTDTWDDKLRYAGCSGECTDPARWWMGTADTGYYIGTTGAVVTDAGISVVGGVGSPSRALRFSQCPGDCQFSHWQSVTLFAGAWLTGYFGPHVWPLASDASGGLHLAYHTLLAGNLTGLAYAYCPASCLNSGNWQTTVLDTVPGDDRAYLINADPSGRVHVLYTSAKGVLAYLTCAGSCVNAANWQAAVVDTTTSWLGGVSLALTPAGGLRIVYLSSDSVRYATCDTGCAGAGSWGWSKLGGASQDVSLVLGTDGILHLATNSGVVWVSSCASMCGLAGSWTLTKVDSARGSGFVSLALDQADTLHIASSYDFLQYTMIR